MTTGERANEERVSGLFDAQAVLRDRYFPLKTLRTAVYGDVLYSLGEVEVLHTAVFQRLYDLKQLGFTDRVWPDAVHSRFNHSLGVVERMDQVLRATARSLAQDTEERYYASALAAGADEKTNLTGRELVPQIEQHYRGARLMALLHDLGHGPFGHTLEDEIELLTPKHDSPQRQVDFFNHLTAELFLYIARERRRQLENHIAQSRNGSEEEKRSSIARLGRALRDLPRKLQAFELRAEADGKLSRAADLIAGDAEWLAAKVIEAAVEVPVQNGEAVDSLLALYAPTTSHFLADLLFAMRGLLWLTVVDSTKKTPAREMKRDQALMLARILGEARISILPGASWLSDWDACSSYHSTRDVYFIDMVGNTICADLLDYTKRDTHGLGIASEYDERIFSYFTVVTDEKHSPFEGEIACLRLGLQYIGKKLRTEMVGELIQVLSTRLWLAERVLLHRTKCAAGAMLATSLQLLALEGSAHSAFFTSGDSVFRHRVLSAAYSVRDRARSEDPVVRSINTALAGREDRDQRLEGAIQLLEMLNARRYHEIVFQIIPGTKPRTVSSERLAKVFTKSQYRYELERRIEQECELQLGDIVVHCPDPFGPRKLARALVVGKRKTEAVQLRAIDTLEKEIFSSHAEVIRAMEQMYVSAWRLRVYASPCYQGDHKSIGAVVSAIIKDICVKSTEFEDGEAEFFADLYLTRELEGSSLPEKTMPDSDLVQQIRGTKAMRRLEADAAERLRIAKGAAASKGHPISAEDHALDAIKSKADEIGPRNSLSSPAKSTGDDRRPRRGTKQKQRSPSGEGNGESVGRSGGEPPGSDRPEKSETQHEQQRLPGSDDQGDQREA